MIINELSKPLAFFISIIFHLRNLRYCIKHSTGQYDEFYWHNIVSKFNKANNCFRGWPTVNSLNDKDLEELGYKNNEFHFEQLREEFNSSNEIKERITFI